MSEEAEAETPAGAPGDQATSTPPERSADWIELRAASDTAGWSDEDITWLERMKPEIMRPVAKRYGRPCMDLVIRGGVIGHGFERLQASRPPPAMDRLAALGAGAAPGEKKSGGGIILVH